MRIFYLLFLLSVALMLPMSLYARDHEGWILTHFNSENGLPQNTVNFAEMDNDGYLWLATQAGIVRYDGQRFRLFDNSNSSLLRNRYWKLGKDSSGRIYCMDDYLKTAFYDPQAGFSKPKVIKGLVPSIDGGLIDLNKLDMGRLAPFTSRFSHSSSSDAVDFAYYPTSKEKGFISWRYDLGYVSNGKVQWTHPPVFFRPTVLLSVGVVGNKYCFITRNRGIILVDSNGIHARQKIPVTFPREKSLVNFTSVAFFRQEHQMLLNLDGDIYEVGLTDDRLEFRHLIRVKDISFINCIRYYPERGLLIIGSNTQGLFIFRKQQLVSVGENVASGGAFYALAPYGGNQVFSVTGRLPGTPIVPGTIEAFDKGTILHDRNRHYWYGNWLTLLETDDQFRVLKKVPLTQWLQCVQEDEQGTIWLSQGPHNFGRVLGGTFQPYKLEVLAEKNIISFIPLGNQTFWLVGKGLCMWLDVKHHRRRIYHEFDNVELRTVYRDKKGNLWLGSYGQGYFLFRNGRFTKMPEDEAHHLKIVHCFLEDRKGFIWMTTNNGLFQSAVNDLYSYASGRTRQVYHHYYGKESGLKTSEFNGGCTPSGLQLASGRLAFPSMNGVVLFHPDSIKPALPATKLFIEQILLDGTPANRPQLLQLSPSFKRLELTVSSPHFGHPNNLNIRYNVEGLDDRWYPLGENNRIVLNTLNYGRYKLRLRKEAGFGSNHYITTELPLMIMPFFYQTWWFLVLVVAGIASIISMIIKMRYKYLVRQRNRLEAEVKDRTSELAYHSKLMEKLTLMIAHDLKSPLYFLSKVTGHLRQNVQQENFQGIDRTSSEIKNTADQVYQFIEEFNLWASSFTEGFTLNTMSFPLDELLQELGLFFREMLDSNGNRLILLASAHYVLDTDRELFKVILRNIVDNANKHSHSSDICISVSAENDEYIAITIADQGVGMSEPILKRIHDRITQASTAAGIERNSRLGYQMIIDFAARLAAKLEVQSERGKGTSVTLRIQGKVGTKLPEDSVKQIISAG